MTIRCCDDLSRLRRGAIQLLAAIVSLKLDAKADSGYVPDTRVNIVDLTSQFNTRIHYRHESM